jgi:hypothetical protein
MLIIADCHHIIEFEFYLGDKLRRRQSLAKANLLIDHLTSFRDALAREIELIENSRRASSRGQKATAETPTLCRETARHPRAALFQSVRNGSVAGFSK